VVSNEGVSESSVQRSWCGNIGTMYEMVMPGLVREKDWFDVRQVYWSSRGLYDVHDDNRKTVENQK